MAYEWLTDLDEALAAYSIPFVEVGWSSLDPTGAADWRSRGRPSSTGEFIPSGVLCHHTASGSSVSDQGDLNVILAGNSSAPGPISQLFIGRSATVQIVAAGRANHGGKGKRPDIDWSCADMNAHLLGIEVSNNGVGEYWNDAQTDVYAAVVAALIDWYGWELSDVYLHATTGPPNGGCNSKIDPAGPWRLQPHLVGSTTWSLDVWRGYVDEHRGAAPGAPPTPPAIGDDIMFINKNSIATFSTDGSGFCQWIPTSQDADMMGCPPPDAQGRRGTPMTDAYFRGLVLIGPFPTDPGLSPAHFRAWWPDGVPQSAQWFPDP